MGKLPRVLQGLLIANAVLFLVTEYVPGLRLPMYEALALWFPRHEHFGVWQFVTSVFMHGGLSHIFFNMFALLSFGLPLQHMWGTRRFLVFYFLCGIGAAVIHTVVQWVQFQSLYQQLVDAGVAAQSLDAMLQSQTMTSALHSPGLRSTFFELFQLYGAPMLGASGAIYGMLVAFAFSFPNARLSLMFLPVPIPAKYFIPAIVGLDLLSGVTGFSVFGGGIAHFAHVGGALIGFLLMLYWRRTVRTNPLVEPF